MIGRAARLKLLLMPSLLSGSISVLLSAVLLGAAAWSYRGTESMLHDYLFGPYGVATLFVQDANQTISASSYLYYAFVAIVAVIIGITVYALLEGLRKTAQTTKEIASELQGQVPEIRNMAKDNIMRVLVRAASILLWLGYTLLFTATILPFCIVFLRVNMDEFSESALVHGLLIAGVWLFLALCIHLHVIFARLSFLRLRIFGVADIEISEQQQHSL